MIKQSIGDFFMGLGMRMQGYDAGESNRVRRDLAYGRQSARSEDKLVGDQTRLLMRQKASDLRRNNAVVAGVCDRLALFTLGAHGIKPQCKTSDTEWNRAAESWWSTIYSPACDSRGRASLLDFQWQAVSLRPTHGGLYFQKLDDGTIRPIECERILQPQDATKAKAFVDGVKVDETTGRIKTFSVHTRDQDGGFTAKHQEQDVDAEKMLRVIRPPWRPDQVREIPDLAPIIPALQDIAELNHFTLNTAKWQSTPLAFLAKQGGNGLNSMKRGTTPSVGGKATIKTEWGEILEGIPGDSLTMLSSATPKATHIPYVKMQWGLCASALSMPYEFFTLDLQNLDYSRQKGMLLLVNFAIRPWKKWLTENFLQPLWNWRVAMEMAPGRSLSGLKPVDGVSEWMKVDWQWPEELWIDRQENMQADVLEVQAGLSTLSECAARRGKDLEDTVRTRARELAMIAKVADEEGCDPDDLSKMQIPGQTEKEETPGAESKPDEKKEVKDDDTK